MSKEQNNQGVLVEQDEALGFYFDSLLLTDEVEYLDDMQESHSTPESETDSAPEQQQTDSTRETVFPETENNDNSSQNRESVKDFLQASKMPQQTHRQQKQVTPEMPIQEPFIQGKEQTEPEQSEPTKQAEPKQPIHKNIDTAVNIETRIEQSHRVRFHPNPEKPFLQSLRQPHLKLLSQ